MWPSTVVVIVASCIVSSIVSEARLVDNDVSLEDDLQDLAIRTKKSPVDEIPETTPADSKSSPELVALLSEDIRKKLDDLKNFRKAYTKLEDDLLGSAKGSNDSSLEEIETDLLKPKAEKPLEEPLEITSDESSDDEDSLRIARQNYGQLTVDGSGKKSVLYNGKSYPVERMNGPVLNSYHNEDPYIAQGSPYARNFEKSEVQEELHVQPVTIQTISHQHQPHPLKQIKQLIPGLLSALTSLIKPLEPASPHPAAVPVVVKPIHTHIKPVVVHKKPEAVIHTVTPVKPHHAATGSKKPPGFFFSKQLIFGIGTDDETHHHQEINGDVHGQVHGHGEGHGQVYGHGGAHGQVYGQGQGQYYFIPVISSPVVSPYVSPSYYSYPIGGADYPYIYPSYPGSYSNYGSAYGAGYGYPDDQLYGYSSAYSPYQQGHSSLDSTNPASPSPVQEETAFPSDKNIPDESNVRDSSSAANYPMAEKNYGRTNSEISKLKSAIEVEQEKVKKFKEEMEPKPVSDKKQDDVLRDEKIINKPQSDLDDSLKKTEENSKSNQDLNNQKRRRSYVL